MWLKLRRYVLMRHKTNLIDETSIIIFFRNQAVQMQIKQENCTSKEKSGNFVMMWAYMDGMGVVHYSSYREVTLQVSKKILWVVFLMAKRTSIQCGNLLAIKEILLATVSSLIATPTTTHQLIEEIPIFSSATRICHTVAIQALDLCNLDLSWKCMN